MVDVSVFFSYKFYNICYNLGSGNQKCYNLGDEILTFYDVVGT